MFTKYLQFPAFVGFLHLLPKCSTLRTVLQKVLLLVSSLKSIFAGFATKRSQNIYIYRIFAHCPKRHSIVLPKDRRWNRFYLLPHSKVVFPPPDAKIHKIFTFLPPQQRNVALLPFVKGKKTRNWIGAFWKIAQEKSFYRQLTGKPHDHGFDQ